MSYQSVFRENAFADRTIIVTGGGSGIGRCVAHELAALGARVAIIGRKQEKLDRVLAEIQEDGGRASAYVCDIREEDKVKAVIAEILAELGPVHGLVNNAGGQYPAPLSAINQKGFETVVRTNLVGGFLMARELYNQCFNKQGGAIVNIIADMWGGMPGMGHSGAARAGMDNFTKTAAVEWAAAGVRVNAVAPGWIASSGLDHYDASMKPMLLSLANGVPLKRLGTEAEVSAAICFLLSKAAAFISGATLRVDGAASLGGRVWPLPKAKNVPVYNGFHRAVRPKVLDD
ncbi:SDR family oxidoreductase [Hahella sp. CR1]|uniref:SDR family oxidoreductase n=1 Tax=Hahella sp. CR1 TaxID=2992807 RepID=UPI00244358B2|nr:SDR family oxidoreductase [Hahella sp. CR1]MDG9670823.1 SDR family oxidoreductase [Hahella sp. CR1]